MSRCVACDKNLNDYESTRKIVQSDGKVYYPDLCNSCYSSTDIEQFAVVIERHDLKHDNYNEDLELPEE